MDARQAYKFAFLQRCLEEGLNQSQIQERITKSAALDVTTILGWLGKALGGGARLGVGALAAGIPIAGVTGAATGLAGGTAAAKLMDPGYEPEEINRQELVNTYDTLTKDMEEKRKAQAEVRGL